MQQPDIRNPMLYVLVGLPGAGKTTRARQIEREHRALRLTPDEWMIPLFGDAEAGGKRDVLEGRLVWLAREILRRGVDVVLDFGVWSRDERAALRHLAAECGASCVLVYLPIDEAEQRGRVAARYDSAPESTFAVTHEDLQQFREQFEVPDASELLSTSAGPPPTGFATWQAWTEDRWPTSTA